MRKTLEVEWKPTSAQVAALMMALRAHVDWLCGGECVACGLSPDCSCDAHPHLTTLVLTGLKRAGAQDEAIIALGTTVFGIHPDKTRAAILAYAATPQPNGPRPKGSN